MPRPAAEIEPQGQGETEQSNPGVLFETPVSISGVLFSDPMTSHDFGDIDLKPAESDRLHSIHVVFKHSAEGAELADKIRALTQEGRKVILTISEALRNTQ